MGTMENRPVEGTKDARVRSWAIPLLCVVAAVLMVVMLAGCSSGASSSSSSSASSEQGQDISEQASAESVHVNVASLKGPTSIGLVDFMQKADAGETVNDYSFTISGSPDEVLPAIIQGDADIALIPANAASTVYNKTDGGVQVIDINTLGVLYVVSGDAGIDSLDDLAGRTVYMTGKGATPEYAMNYLLDKAGIADQVTLEFKSEASEVAAVLASDANAVGVLPEPYVTSVCLKNAALAPRVSLTEVWDDVQASGDGSRLVMGVTVVRTEFAEEHPEAVQEFLEGQSSSVASVNENPKDASQLVVDAGIMENAAAAEQAIPRCNLVCIQGSDMHDALSGYLATLYEQDPSSIGGALPGDDFYYGA